MIKSIAAILVLMALSGYGGYVVGTKAPTVGDCVNSFLGGK